jgi:hypothetical protein
LAKGSCILRYQYRSPIIGWDDDHGLVLVPAESNHGFAKSIWIRRGQCDGFRHVSAQSERREVILNGCMD